MFVKIGLYLILTVSGLLLFKVGGVDNSIEFTLSNIKMNISILSLVGIGCYGSSFLLWLNIIKDNNLSYIFPVANGLVTVMTVLSGLILLNEKIQITQWLGILCIIVGVFIVNLCK